MFIGHFAPAFAARAITGEAPKLGTLFIAAQLVDWIFFLLVLGEIEHMRPAPGITAISPIDFYDYPYTHSLAGTAIIGVIFGLVVAVTMRNPVAAVWGSLVVCSHWVLDWVSHRSDLTLAGGETTFGLGLWNFPLAAMVLEVALSGLAFWWYLARTSGPVVPPLILLGALLALQSANWFGPQPTDLSIPFIAPVLLAFAVLTALAYWVGKTRWHRAEVGLGVASPPP